jgi:hypothetical protein
MPEQSIAAVFSPLFTLVHTRKAGQASTPPACFGAEARLVCARGYLFPLPQLRRYWQAP